MEHRRCGSLAMAIGRVDRRQFIAAIALCFAAGSSERASADNGGLSFWRQHMPPIAAMVNFGMARRPGTR
jgi:hypothetical protein